MPKSKGKVNAPYCISKLVLPSNIKFRVVKIEEREKMKGIEQLDGN